MVVEMLSIKDSIVVLSIATNKYLEYWKQLVSSADENTLQVDNVRFWIFTDQPDEAKKHAKKLSNILVEVFEIPSLGWPEATILRYEIFLKEVYRTEIGIFVYLDADMLIVGNPWEAIRENLLQSEICLVEHPGYWRLKGKERIFCYFQNPRLLLRDVRLLTRYGSLGKWETRRKSSAHVRRHLRKKYYCGGIWFGKQNAIAKLINQLSVNVAADRSRGVMAIWHDESHLNQWASKNTHADESPRLCFDGTYSHLDSLDPLIHAVRKSEIEAR